MLKHLISMVEIEMPFEIPSVYVRAMRHPDTEESVGQEVCRVIKAAITAPAHEADLLLVALSYDYDGDNSKILKEWNNDLAERIRLSGVARNSINAVAGAAIAPLRDSMYLESLLVWYDVSPAHMIRRDPLKDD